MATIIRQTYIDKIEKYLGKETIIVLVGQRRVGKSYMMKTIRDQKANDPDNNIIYIDKEKRDFDSIKNYQDLNQYIDEHFDAGKHNYILIDEIQDIHEFERSIRSFRTEPNTDIIITGSNAKMLSNELSTLICGRYKEIYIQSLSYEEFLIFHQLPDSDDSLAKYIQYGGLPALAKIGLEEDDAREYQMDIYQHLIRLGYQVYVGQLQAGEIDFVCTKPDGQRIYVQASYIIADMATREREFGNLRTIKDNYPKYVISMTPLVTSNDDDGITHLHLRKFLKEGF